MSRKYILDSDILIYFLKGKRDTVESVIALPKADLYTTIINYTELLYGVYNSTKITQNREKIVPFLETFQLLPFDKEAGKIFAKEKARLKKEGKPIADMDLMIASIAIANDAHLFTNNLKHFGRIDGLKLL